MATVAEYERWLVTNKQQIPTWFPVDTACEAFRATYPFHPSVLSVFERKWQGLPRFQQTRGVLRLLAIWVSMAYRQDYQRAHKDLLISLGSAPVENPLFRAAVFEQLGELRLEPAVTTDIAGKDHAHALRLDAEAKPEIQKSRLHRKVATAILFESNGGQQRAEATLPEVRLAVAEPSLDIGHVEHCLDALSAQCYFLASEKHRYRFSFRPNLNKLLADRRASVTPETVDKLVRMEIQRVFNAGPNVERIFFPMKTNEIPDRPVLTLVVAPPDALAAEIATRRQIARMTTECGASTRTFKSAIIWAVAEDTATLFEEARKLLAWRDIAAEADDLRLDETQLRQLDEYTKRAERDMREAVWRSYNHVFLLAEGNAMRTMDLGLVHSSAAKTLVDLIISNLRQVDVVVDGVGPSLLTRYWPPALPDWSTESVRDAFYASPKFPRLLRSEAVKDTISRGVESGAFAYVGKASDGSYEPFVFKQSLGVGDVEVSEDVYLIVRERAEAYLARTDAPQASASGEQPDSDGTDTKPSPTPSGASDTSATSGVPRDAGPGTETEIAGFRWTGEVSPQKWTNFYSKVLSRFSTAAGLRLSVTVDVEPPGGMSMLKVEQTRAALRELGVSAEVSLRHRHEK